MPYKLANEVFIYDDESCQLKWKIDIGYKIKGYLRVEYKSTAYMVHRIIWLLNKGYWPDEVDHINGIKSDNRIENLRDSNRSQNMQNQRKAQRNNKTGFLGVSPARDKYKATITLNKKQSHLGCFERPEDAHIAYLDAKRALHEACMI